jgi:hypothetical protein
MVSATSIDRCYRLSKSKFTRHYLFPKKPVVINGSIDQWAALKTWSPSNFKARFGDRRIAIDGKVWTIADFIDRVSSSGPESPAPYLRNVIIEDSFPELLEEISPLPPYCTPNWLGGPLADALRSRLHGGTPELYIGGSGGKFPFLHFDSYHTNAFICQICGTKEFTLYSEDQTPLIYVSPRQYNASTVSDIENPDLRKFPLFAKARPTRFRLEPGEVLFIPGGWWHTAKILSPSISVSVNQANASNWSRMTRDMFQNAPLHLKPLALGYLTGMRIFRTLYGS